MDDLEKTLINALKEDRNLYFKGYADGLRDLTSAMPYIYDKDNEQFIFIEKVINARALETVMGHDNFKKFKNKFTEKKEMYIKDV